MRVAIFSDTYRPRIGGVTLSVLTTAEVLRARGVDVIPFVPSPHPGAQEPNTIFFPTIRISTGGTKVRTGIPYFPRVAAQFTSANVHLVHSFSAFFIGRYGRRLAVKHGLPTVLTYQTQYGEYTHFLPFGKYLTTVSATRRIIKNYMPRWTRNLCNSFHCIVVPTESAADALKDVGVTSRIEVIPVGFDIDASPDSYKNIRSRFTIPADTFLLLYVGRLSPEKNLPFLIRAFASARKGCDKELHLMLVGDGPERFPLEQLVRSLALDKQVTFAGEIAHEGIGDFYGSADGFVFSSVTDVQAFVVCEALMAGLPVVAVRAPGPADFITDGQEGLLTGYDETAFAQAILKLVSNLDLQIHLSQKARDLGKHFTKKQYADSLISLYVDLIENFSAC